MSAHSATGRRQAHREREDGQAALQESSGTHWSRRCATSSSDDDADQDARAHPCAGFAGYRHDLAPERRLLLDRFRLVDIARKVVGVGSVGTRCLIVLLRRPQTTDDRARPAVQGGGRAPCSSPTPDAASVPPHRGARVVHGQRAGAAGERHLPRLERARPTVGHALLLAPAASDMKASAEIAVARRQRQFDELRATPAPGASPTRTPAPATPSPSPPTSAPATPSTRRWARSLQPTPSKRRPTGRP